MRLKASDVEKAPATVSSQTIQGKLEKEQEKDYCPTGTYISMVIAYPVEVVNVQIARPDPKPELEGLHCMPIDIDVNNFPKIFPSRHVEFLDNNDE
ncbi:hypothetical protein F5H01DRAFT_370854 [Linnemannia elongata]|nr:hypothetical protein F5H01DRAFT_370854 [Linnemannia elongata]